MREARPGHAIITGAVEVSEDRVPFDVGFADGSKQPAPIGRGGDRTPVPITFARCPTEPAVVGRVNLSPRGVGPSVQRHQPQSVRRRSQVRPISSGAMRCPGGAEIRGDINSAQKGGSDQPAAVGRHRDGYPKPLGFALGP